MYKLVIYGLIAIIITVFIESFLKIIPYSPLSLFVSLIICIFSCLLINYILAKLFKLPVQYESSLITSLIIFLIILPAHYSVFIACFFAIISKYIFTIRDTHIFNPAAVGIFTVTALGFGTSFWWVGSVYLLPIVLLVSLIIIRKTGKTTMFWSGILAAFAGVLISAYFLDLSLIDTLYYTFISGPIIFFLGIMLTEPHTVTKNLNQQIFYSSIIILIPFLSNVLHLFLNTPNITLELSLLIGNIISFVISDQKRHILKLESITKLNPDTFEYNFINNDPNKKNVFNFKSGEYAEWSLDHTKPDFRGIRRYFTISSAPNINNNDEKQISFATKFPTNNPSTFKQNLLNLKIGQIIYATQISGDFILPEKKLKKIIMIAGGIGITPFISQLRDLINKNNKNQLQIILFYCTKSVEDCVYTDLLEKARNVLDLKIVNVHGILTKEILTSNIDKYENLEYFISGPNIMVDMVKNLLNKINVEKKVKNHVHTDYFPGY